VTGASPSKSEPFASAAWYYARFRQPYPVRLFELASDRFRLDGRGKALDVGCGTGQLAIPLSPMFEEVVAVDMSAEMVAEARVQVAVSRAENLQFLTMKGEEISRALGEFRLVCFGSSLHWMDIDLVLRRSREMLTPRGGLLIVGQHSIWGGASEWEQAVVATIQRWLGSERRAGIGGTKPLHRPFNEAIADAGFNNLESGKIPCEHTWDIPYIIGHLYSTSYCNRALLGNRASAFEEDLTRTLLEIEPLGHFKWRTEVDYGLASKS
jgi:SAM-dependent methyltransferase